MSIRLLLILLLGCLLTLTSCGEEGGPTSASQNLDGASLLGLTNNHTLRYLKTDTLVYIDSTYHFDITEDTVQFVITGSANEWVIRAEDDRGLNIELDAQSVLLAGFRRIEDSVEVAYFFANRPAKVHRALTPGDSWTGYTPSFTTATGSLRLPLYFANFGFYFSRTYEGVESISAATGDYAAHKYHSDLFLNQDDQSPVALVDEHYAPNVGLVRLQFRGGGLVRTLSLIQSF